MSTSTFQALTVANGVLLLIALGVAIFSFGALLVHWKSPKRKRDLWRLIGAIIAVPCLVVLHYSLLFFVYLPTLRQEQLAIANTSRARRLSESSVVTVGDLSPAFSVSTIDGHDFTLPAEGSVVLVNFFATWCGPCIADLPHLEEITMEYRSNDRFQIIALGREETIESVTRFREEQHLSLPMAADPDRAIYSQFAEQYVPRTVVIGPDGRIAYSQIGFREEDLGALRAAIEKQLASAR